MESTKSGGLHYLLRFRTPLDPSKAERVTGLGGYVDVFHGGILIVAPTRFEGAARGYEVLKDGGIPLYRTLREGLEATSPWLAAAWEEKWQRSKGMPAVRRKAANLATVAVSDRVDPKELEMAMEAIRQDPAALRVFERGARHRDGTVDRSMTEFRLAVFLEMLQFSEDCVWEVVRMCKHTKSLHDPRGRRRFEAQVWDRLGQATSPSRVKGRS